VTATVPVTTGSAVAGVAAVVDGATARTVLARQCRLPAATLDALRDDATAAAARELLRSRRTMQALRDRVEDVLHGLVGGCDDTGRRRELLGARRNVHKDVVAARHEALLDEVATDNPDVATWLAAARASRELSGPDDAARGRLASAAGRVVRLLDDPGLRRGIAFASTAFARELDQRPSGPVDPDGRLARTAVSYAVRAALKPSPFSSLATLHAVRSSDVGVRADDGEGWSRDHTTFRPLAVELHGRCVQRPFAWAGPKPVRAQRIPSMQMRSGTYAFLPHYAHQGSLYYRTDELTELTSEAPPLNAADGVATGRLHARRPWALTDGHELGLLAGDGRDRGWPAEVVDALGGAAEAEGRVHRAQRPDEVVDAIEALHDGARDALTAVGSRAGLWLLREPLVHESVSGPALAAPAALPSELARVLSRRVVPLAFYDTLRRLFSALHGSGSAPLVAFCAEATLALERALVGTPDRHELDDLPRGHLSLARPASVVYHQHSGGRVVVNTVMADYLGSRSRWGRLATLTGDLVADAVTTATTRHPGTVAYQFSASTDWTTTQRPGPGLPLAEWGPALLDHPGAHDLAAFRIHLDPDTRTLQLTDPDGAPAALLYGGAIPPHLLKGVEGVLAVIASPWAVLPPTARAVEVDGGLVTPRLEGPDVVWGRRTWSLSPEVVPTWARGGHVTDVLARVEAMRERFAMPGELFVATVEAGSARPVGKPTWLSVDHPLTVLTALRDPGPRVRRWVFTEALPALAEAGSSAHGEGGYVTEFVAVVDHG
jgi:hypothetical protein